jgi:hypothetical protein
MPMNGFTLGKDVAIDIIDPNTSAILQSFKLRTAFEYKQLTSRVTIKGSDGIVRYLELPEGWEGSLEYERQNSDLDRYIASLETNYYAGLNLLPATLTATVSEVSGAPTTMRFQGVVWKLAEGGQWQSDNTIKQRLDWCASLRNVI